MVCTGTSWNPLKSGREIGRRLKDRGVSGGGVVGIEVLTGRDVVHDPLPLIHGVYTLFYRI
jgi:hypothetical protein